MRLAFPLDSSRGMAGHNVNNDGMRRLRQARPLLPNEDMTTQSPDQARLCYIDAASVDVSFPRCDDIDVWGDENVRIGRLDGLVLDAEARQVEYLVIDTKAMFRRRRYLLPFSPMRLDAARRALRVDADKTSLTRCEEFEPQSFHPYSDDDLMAALFPKHPRDASL